MKNRSITIYLFVFLSINWAAFAQQYSLPNLISKIENSVFTVLVVNDQGVIFSQGSGFFIHSSGIGITNFHVLNKGYSASIVTKDGAKIPIIEVMDYDEDADLVKFRVEKRVQGYDALNVTTAIPMRGSEVISLSSPLGLEQTVSTGIVSAVRDSEIYGKVIQMTAPISHGSSGSPILNKEGEVLGISTFGIEQGQSLNFAVSSIKINELSKDLGTSVYSIWNNPLETVKLKKARTLRKEGDLDSAIILLDEELKNYPENHVVLAELAYTLLANEENGIKYIFKAIQLDSLNADYFNILGIYGTRFSDWERGDQEAVDLAFEAYSEAIRLEPNNSTAYSNLALLFYKNSFHYKLLNEEVLPFALELIDTAFELNPTSDNLAIRARIKVALKEFGGAAFDCDRALMLEPELAEAYFVRGDLKAFELHDLHGGLLDVEKALSLVDYNYTNSYVLADSKSDMLGIKAEICWRLALKEGNLSFYDMIAPALEEAFRLTSNEKWRKKLVEYERIISQ